jgi:menaquinone-9 beta-reductase
MNAYDAVIVGAGPAGSTAAILLSQAGWSVAIVEKQRFPRRKVCGECVAATNLPLINALGLRDRFAAVAGPPLRTVGLFAGEERLTADLPRFEDDLHPWGRAIGRESLDTLLLQRAAECGAHVWQPWSVKRVLFDRERGRKMLHLARRTPNENARLSAPLVIDAHGSWDPDPFAQKPGTRFAGPSALFGFKTTYANARLAAGVLPVLAFPGGYGGLVVGERQRTTFAFCMRHDALRRCRQKFPGLSAARAAGMQVALHCAGVRDCLESAHQIAPWLTVGPLQPGCRTPWRNGDRVFAVGNAAGEAHPILGEGISLAIQSAWLLCSLLIERPQLRSDMAIENEVAKDYCAQWRRSFATRFRVAALFAHTAMNGPTRSALLWMVRICPPLLTTGARLGAKARLKIRA